MENGCALDVTVQTQMLKYRTRQIGFAPKVYLSTAVEQLLVSYNKLKSRITHSKVMSN